MQYTSNYNMTIAEGTDTVNLLTQSYPNFTTLDTVVKEVSDSAVTSAAETKVGTVHNLVRTSQDRTLIKFTATSNYTTGDTFTVDGVAVTAVTTGGTALKTGAFLINSNVLCILNGLVLTVLVSEANADASDISFDNTGTGLLSTDVQNAIEEVKNAIPSVPASYAATAITYDNSGSGLTATNAQDAIDELAANVGGGYVEVVADGVKSYRQLLNTLYSSVDYTKLNTKSVLSSVSSGITSAYQLYSYANDSVRFEMNAIDSNNKIYGMSLLLNASTSSIRTKEEGAVYADISASIPAVGYTFRLTY